MSYQALELDGNGYASISDASQKGLNMGLSDFMIEVLFKTSASGAYNVMTSKITGNLGWELRQRDTDKLGIVIHTDGATYARAISSATYNNGQWHYGVGVIDRSSATGMKLFIGGTEVSYDTQEDPTGIGNIDTAANLGVGARGGGTEKFTGLLDECRIWNFGKDGLPGNYADYITWRAEGRNIYLDISNFSGGAWNGYADALRTDLLTNGDMELDANWTARGTPTTEVRSSEQANNGTYSWKIVSDATSEGAYQDITTVVGKWYEVTGYVYVTAGDVKLGKEDTDGSDQVLTGQATAAAWNEFNVIFKATETTSRIFFQSDATAASTFYVDDMKAVRTGLVARYKFSGNYNDETANANHLTAGGTGNTFPGYSLRSKAQKMLLGVG